MTYLFTSKLNLLITISSFYYFTVGEIWLPRLCFRGKCSRDKSHFPGRRGPKHDGRSWKAVEETENTAFCTFRLCLRFACPWNLSSSPVFCYPEFSTENTFQKISSCQIFQPQFSECRSKVIFLSSDFIQIANNLIISFWHLVKRYKPFLLLILLLLQIEF